MKTQSKMLPGLLLALLVGLPAYLLGKALPLLGGPVSALLLGMLLHLLLKGPRPRYQAGLRFVSKRVLQWAVILLGFGLQLTSLLRVGLQSLPVILSTITIALCVGHFFGKALRIDRKTRLMIAVGSSICGGSAVAAVAPVLDSREDEIARAISVIFFFNLLAAILFPPLGRLLGMSHHGFALFAGTAINDTSSVTAAASSWDQFYQTSGQVLQTATIVKLTRTLAILPITLFLAWKKTQQTLPREGEDQPSAWQLFPKFILYFLLASLLTTLSLHFFSSEAPKLQGLFQCLQKMSKILIVFAMAAIGLQTDLPTLLREGKRPLLLGLACCLCISLLSLSLQKGLGLW